MSEALIVEDDRSSLDALATLVELEGFEVRTAPTLAEAQAFLEHKTPAVVLADLMLPDGQGTQLLEQLQDSTAEVVLITGNATLETAVEALRLGAYDYLTKPIDEARLKALLANLHRTRELKQEVNTLRRELRQLGRFGAMVGTSKAMQKVYDLLEKGAPTHAPIFLAGESGTGKELAAETVHQLSRRRHGPFIAVNCGAVSATLIESELFGHEKGSFTGANRQHKGFFEQADGGTLFLDEITEMPLELQVKLLRVLETKKVTRVGGDRALDVDVRIVAATNREASQAVDKGQLRADLLYRLRVFPVPLPPLRQRHGDVIQLARHFLELMGEREGVGKEISSPALEVLERYTWPGNVRELRNVMERAYILADEVVTTECLPPEVLGQETSPAATGSALEMRVGMTIADAERKLIEATLDELEGDKKRAADMLGISLKTLYNRLNAYQEEQEEE